MFTCLPAFLTSIFLMSLFSACLCEDINYDRYSLLRITPKTESQLKSLSDAKLVDELEFWLRTTAVNHSADVMVKPTIKKQLIQQLASLRIPYRILIHDIGKKIKEDNATPKQKAKLGFFNYYPSLEEIDQYVQDLVEMFPECLSLIPYGTSFEGRPLQMLKISSKPSERKSSVWIQGGQHAREQIGPVTVVYIATKLASLCYKKDEENYKLLDSFDWYILTVLNPDGYEYAQNTDRLWRKTRSRHPNSQNCVGVDANRNWDINWSDDAGSSSRPCSHYYAGPRAFSEPETKAVSEFMLNNLKGRLTLFLDLHSYSQRWLTPYGYFTKLPPNYHEQRRLALVATRALELVNGTKNSVGSTGNIMYTVTGGARDWVYDTMEAKYSYVVELRDKGDFGFILPRRFILPTAMETWEGIKAMGLDMAEKLNFDKDSL